MNDNAGHRHDEQAVAFASEKVERLRQAVEDGEVTAQPELAGALIAQSDALVVRYRQRGVASDLDQALRSITDAVAIYRRLVDAHLDDHLPHLAGALIAQSDALVARYRQRGDPSDLDQALRSITDAVAIYGRLVDAHPDDHLPHLGGALLVWYDALTARYSQRGDPADLDHAGHVAERAVDIYRRLAAYRPDEFQPQLASALVSQSDALAARADATGKDAALDDATHAIMEAVSVYRSVAAAHPSAYLPQLAGALSNLGILLGGMGRLAESLEASDEAVTILARLADEQGDAVIPGLASTLGNQSVSLSVSGRRDEALAAGSQAVDLLRQLSKGHPDAHQPSLARSLTNLGVLLADVGQVEDALQASEEAVALYRELASQDPGAYLPGLSDALRNLGAHLDALGRRAEASHIAADAAAVDDHLSRTGKR